MSRLPPACRPPEIILTMGSGKAGSSVTDAWPAGSSMISPESVEMNEQLFAAGRRRRVRDRQRNAEQGVGPEPALVRRTVERDQPGVEAGLIVQIDAHDGRGDFAHRRCRRPCVTPSPP